jgi:hypothetical protein
MADFGFVGASYEAPTIYQDAQECINWYPEIDPVKPEGSRGVIALLPTPGYRTIVTLPNGPVRGMRAINPFGQMVAVAANKLYVILADWTYTEVGTLVTSTGPVSITETQTTDDGASNGVVAYIADGIARYIYNLTTSTFTQLSSDGPWASATVCDYANGYVVYNKPDSQLFTATDPGSAYTTSGLYGRKDGGSDNLISLFFDHQQLFLFGEYTTEVWVESPGTDPTIASFPFAPISGTFIQHGINAPFSVARWAETFMFVTRDLLGHATIGTVNGYQFVRLSTHAVENSLIGYDVSDAIAYSMQITGHEWYIVTFPNANITWVYDSTTKLWFKWMSLDAFNNFQRNRGNCATFFNTYNLVGDYENGKIYIVDTEVFTEGGNPIRRLRRTPHLVADFQREYFEELQIQFQPGVGLATGQGENPQAMLRWSNDGGSTWSNEHWTSIGRIGKYQNRAIWRRLGMARDRVWEVSISDPVKAAIISANLKASVGDN